MHHIFVVNIPHNTCNIRTVKYLVNVNDTQWPTTKHHLTKTVQEFLDSQQTVDDYCQMYEDDIRMQEIYCHNAEMDMHTKTVPVHIVSPIATLSWFYMLPAWRQLLDFNFHRSEDWTKDTPIIRFNDCEYVQKHQIYDS